MKGMSRMITKEDFMSKLDGLNIKYNIEKDLIIFSQTGKYNFQYYITVQFQENIFVLNFYTELHFPNADFEAYEEINNLNKRYKFFSFFLNENNKNELVLTADVDTMSMFAHDSLFNLIISGTQILDDIYPEIQKIIWRN